MRNMNGMERKIKTLEWQLRAKDRKIDLLLRMKDDLEKEIRNERTGRWMSRDPEVGDTEQYCNCSVCDGVIPATYDQFPYCPWCRTRME